MAVNEKDCEEMIREANEQHARLMVAYRLHLDPANLEAIAIVRSGKIGEPRFFRSAFSMQVKEGNIRTYPTDRGGGPLYDLGIYCINAARYIFGEEPEEVSAFAAHSEDPRFRETEEMVACMLRFPGEKLASFTCSLGATDHGSYQVVGTKGDLLMNPGFEYAEPIGYELTINGKTKSKKFPESDQLAAEIGYFADCIRNGKDPEPNGQEGLADVRIIRALLESVKIGKPVRLVPFQKLTRPEENQARHNPPVKEPELVHAESPSAD
jgi:glucose-fructose oxidoreductase